MCKRSYLGMWAAAFLLGLQNFPVSNSNLWFYIDSICRYNMKMRTYLHQILC